MTSISECPWSLHRAVAAFDKEKISFFAHEVASAVRAECGVMLKEWMVVGRRR